MQKSYTILLKKLGKEITRLRKVHGLTQQDLSAKCDVDVRTIQRIEKGEYGVGLHILLAIAHSFNMSASDLLSCLKS
ncbi:MAG: helix-turn-helix transcriptional regulator [Bacteroidetes bacterium]|nr:helix-turn-helix transcriptional regulator [Bacteroidota bacterium]